MNGILIKEVLILNQNKLIEKNTKLTGMTKRFSFFIWGLIIIQLLTAAAHSLSFIVEPTPANETEKQLIDLIMNYKMDLGSGFNRTWYQVFTGISVCFTLLFLFFAIINWYFKKKQLSPSLWKGFLLIETILFGLVFAVTIRFTFLPPTVCTAVIFLFSLGSYLSVNTKL